MLKIREVPLQNNCLLSVGQFSLILLRVEMVDNIMAGEILTIKEVAEYLKLSKKTAYRLASDGKLPGFNLRGL